MNKFPHPSSYKKDKDHRSMLIEEKIDGHRLQLQKGKAYGRNLNVDGCQINKWGSLPDCIKEVALNVPIDGEIYLPGYDAADIPTAIVANSPDLRFIGFRVCDKDLYPDEHLASIKDSGLEIPKLMYRPPYTYIEHPNIEELQQEAKNRGIEGWVLKERYQTVHVWWKIKVTKTYDVIITGFNTSSSDRYYGKVKSIKCSAYVDGKLIHVTNVCGMKDEVRLALSNKDIGRIIEVEANLLASKGKLKHPRFIRFRDDKSANECKI